MSKNSMPFLDQVAAALNARHIEVTAEIAALDAERGRLHAALTAVGVVSGRPPARRRKRGPVIGAPRARRGDNLRKVLAATSRPATVDEIARATGIKKATVAATVSTQIRRGVLTRDKDGRISAVRPRRITASRGRRRRG